MLSKCFHCNGYYGPSFGQPLCATCHMFLYADEAALHPTHVCPDKDDGDSGNEEPKEPPDYHLLSNSLPVESNDDDTPSNTAPRKEQYLPLQEGINQSGSQHLCVEAGAASTSHLESIPRGAEADVGENALSSPTGNGFCVQVDWIGLQEAAAEFSHPNETAIEKLPPEVLLVVFRYLDEVSLWSVGQVCRRWNQLVSKCTLNDQWKMFTRMRWPLFMPLYHVDNWNKIFTNLIESAPCQRCLLKMPDTTNPPAQENSWRINRLNNELKSLRTDPPEGISASPLDKVSLLWQASIRGPAGSPYQGGTFFLYIQIPSTYPMKPPLVRFITKIFHPNVSRHGDIGIDSIQHNWSLALTISKVLISIQSLLTDPYTKVCMEPRIGDLYDNNRPQFERIARAWTWRHALHDAIDPESMIPEYLHHLTSEGGILHKVKEEEEEEEEDSAQETSPDQASNNSS